MDQQGLVEWAGAPAPEQSAGVQQHLHETNHAGVVDFDARILGGAHGDGQSEALEQGEVSVHVQALCLEGGKALGDLEKLLAHGGQMREAFPQAEVGEVIGADLIAQEGRELLVLLDEPVLPIGAKGVMAVLELLKRGVQLTFESPGQAAAEDLRDLVGAHAPKPKLTAALEELVDREVALEDQVAAVLDLGDGVEAAQVHPLALLRGELRPENQGPVVQTLADDLGAEAIGRALQSLDFVEREEGVVLLAKAHPGAIELALHE